jgi:hypothetical protein
MNKTRDVKTTTARLLRALGAAALIFSSSGIALATTVVGFNPDPKNVMVGDTFTVDIVGSNFKELAGGTIDLGFDSALLTILSVAVNSSVFDFAPDGGSPAIGNRWKGIGFDTFVHDPATGTVTIATITLKADAEGISSLMIKWSSKFFSATKQIYPALLVGTVNTSSGVVPVPAAVWLFGSGLLGLIGIARRKTS